MSGSWTAYSPLYEEKLAKDGISNLGTGFLLKKNVYIITKGRKCFEFIRTGRYRASYI